MIDLKSLHLVWNGTRTLIAKYITSYKAARRSAMVMHGRQ
jgi:hypothetical protein